MTHLSKTHWRSAPVVARLSRRVTIALIVNALAMSLLWLCFVSHHFGAGQMMDGVYEIQAAMLGQGRLSIVPGPLQLYYFDVIMFRGDYYFYQGLLPSAILLILSSIFGSLVAHYLTVFRFFFFIVFFLQKILVELIDWESSQESCGKKWVWLWAIPMSWLFIFVIPYPFELGWFFSRFFVFEQ